MPIYEFECAACNKHFERLQKVNDPDPGECPYCSAQQVRRCVTAPVFRLAGSGWYETDFKGEKDKKKNVAGSSEKSTTTETKTESKSDTIKPDTSTSTKTSATTPSS